MHNNPDAQCKGVERAKAHMKITHRLLRNMAVLSHICIAGSTMYAIAYVKGVMHNQTAKLCHSDIMGHI